MNLQGQDVEAVETDKVHFSWASNQGDDFIELLQKGFQVKVRVESTIRDVVCDQIGVANEYLDQRITTIFLDGSPVDDVDSATIHAGASLALSAAMPGLVGATMRKAGYYAQMRQGITYVADEQVASDSRLDFFTLKLFNLVAAELGPLFLTHGIWVNRQDLARFLKSRPDVFWSRCLKAELNGREIELSGLAGGKFPGEAPRVYLKCDMMTDSTL
jgi:hypothetical protein